MRWATSSACPRRPIGCFDTRNSFASASIWSSRGVSMKPRPDRVHPYALRGVLQRGRLRHAHDAVLGGDICGRRGEADAAEDRRDVDDRTAAVVEDRRDLRLHVPEDRVEIDRDDLVPIVVRSTRQSGTDAPPMPALLTPIRSGASVPARSMEEAIHSASVASPADAVGHTARRADLVDHVLGGLGVQVVHDYRCAVLRKQQRGGPADSAACAGDDRRAVRNVVLCHETTPSERALRRERFSAGPLAIDSTTLP